jgi:hypothetical protein
VRTGWAARLEKVTARLAADAPNTECPGADLIAYYLSPGRHPAGKGWSLKHTDTQRRLCQRYLAPVIGHVACEDIKTGHLQEAVNAAPTAGGRPAPPVAPPPGRATGSAGASPPWWARASPAGT